MSGQGQGNYSDSSQTWLVGVDLGGTKIAAALLTAEGQIVGDVHQVPTPGSQGRDAVLDAIAGLIVEVLDAAEGVGQDRAGVARPAAIGIGSAGVIDSTRGIVLTATDFIQGWSGAAVCDGLRQRLMAAGVRDPQGAVPLLHLDNDVNAYAAGEAWLGAGRGADSALVVAVGTGVGGALILAGAVHHGTHFLGGEIGHMPCEMAGHQPCTCGGYGHLETVAAGPQIARRYREDSGDESVTTALEVERRANDGDAVAERIYREAAVSLGHGIAQVISAVDPQRIIISGGLSRSGDLWWEPLKQTVRDSVIPLIADDVCLLPASLGTSAPIVGAAHEAWLRLPVDQR